MHVKAFIHKALQDDCHKEGGYDIKTIVFQQTIWPDVEECRVFLADGDVYAALYREGEKDSLFCLMPKEGK